MLFLEEKGGGLQTQEHHPNCEVWGWQHHVVGVLCCRRVWYTSQNRGLHEDGKLSGYFEATSQDISLGHKWGFQMAIDHKHTSKVVAKWLKDNEVKVLEWPSQSSDLNPIENVWAELKKRVRAWEAYKPDSVTPALSGGMGQNSPNLLWEACGRLVEGLTQVKQFKGNATKY